MSKYAQRCNACEKKHTSELREKGIAIVATGRCPDCGQGLHRNLSITGWWQCDGFGAETHRKPGAKPCGYDIIIPS